MGDQSPDSVTRLLKRAQSGDDEAANRLLPLLYDELRALAGGFFNAERPDHTLQPTALVHEVYLRLVHRGDAAGADRTQFIALAVTAMRRILTDYARRRQALKRGGGCHRLTLNDVEATPNQSDVAIMDLDAALTTLAKLDARKCRVVELRFFGGLTNQQVADVLRVSRKTVADDWKVARLWLRRELSAGDSQ